jgi:hypothetical protein
MLQFPSTSDLALASGTMASLGTAPRLLFGPRHGLVSFSSSLLLHRLPRASDIVGHVISTTAIDDDDDDSDGDDAGIGHSFECLPAAP